MIVASTRRRTEKTPTHVNFDVTEGHGKDEALFRVPFDGLLQVGFNGANHALVEAAKLPEEREHTPLQSVPCIGASSGTVVNIYAGPGADFRANGV